MAKLYFLIFWIPAVASTVLLLLCWQLEELVGKIGIVLIAWFFIALAMQFFSPLMSPVWALGIVLQVVLAVFLSLRLKVSI